MAHTAALSTQLSDVGNSLSPTACNLKVQVTSVTDFNDQGLFVYSIDPMTSAIKFSHVASPYELSLYPYNSLDLVNYFTRKNSLEVTYATATLASEGLADIVAVLKKLALDMDALATYEDPTTVNIP